MISYIFNHKNFNFNYIPKSISTYGFSTCNKNKKLEINFSIRKGILNFIFSKPSNFRFEFDAENKSWIEIHNYNYPKEEFNFALKKALKDLCFEAKYYKLNKD